ncbi:MAG: DUF58 domain-containing protein [Actinomycetota bacterium]|nr:DUF58 domain-containing protein [Euzebyaceae bacterium]MDQ3451855.1 DUF58 domain-containing protein [Actinomycetota bacterium]
MPVPTWRVAAVAAVIAGLVLLAPAPDLALIAANGALLVAAIVDWALTPRARRLQVERSVPGIVALDSEAEVVWKVRNPSRRRLRVRLADELVPSLGADSRRARLVLPPLGSATARTRLRPQRRGRFDPTTITLRVQGPLGLAARQGRVTVPGVLRVYPPFHSRDEAELRLSRSRVLQVGLRAAQGRGGGTEFDSLREYSVDDEFRRIDWAATARARKPIVRTYRAERNQTVLVLLDSGRTMAGRVEGVPRLDHAMDAVMMMTAVATRLGDRAGLVAFSDQVRGVVGPSSGRAQLSTVTESMYQLEPELVESDYRGAFVETLGRFRRRALLVVLTELAEQAIAQTLMPALPLVVRDHLVIVAAVRDPAVARWASAVPIEAGAAYRKAAAVQASEQRRLTVAKLRGLGAVVIDATPGRLAPELADAYLKVKSTGRL